MAEIKYTVSIDDSQARKQLKEFLKLTDGEGTKGKSLIDFSQTEKDMQGLLDKLDAVKNKMVAVGNGKSMQSPISDKDIATLQEGLLSMGQLTDASAALYMKYAELKTETDQLSAAKKSLAKEFQSGKITTDQYTKTLAALSKGQLSVASAIQQLNRDIKQSIQLGGVASGSLEEARIKYNQLTAEIVKAGGAMDGSNPAITEMITRHQALRQEIDNVEHQLGQFGRQVGKYPGTWNGLQNSINQLSRELPAFAVSMQTGFLAISNNLPILSDEIGRIKKQNAELVASGQKGVPVWKQLTSSLFSWQTAMSVGITVLTVYGAQIVKFIGSLFQGKAAFDVAKKSFETLNKAIEDNSFSTAVQDVERLRNAVDMARKGFVSKKSVVEEYNKSIGRTTGEVKNLDQVEQFLIKNADNYIKMMMYKAAANLALADAAKEAVEAEKTRIKELSDFTNNFLDAPLQARSEQQYKAQQAQLLRNQQERKDKEVKIHEEAEQKQLNISNKFMQKAQEYASKMNLSVFGDAPKNDDKSAERVENIYDRIAKSRTDLQAKILDLDKEYARKRMESDEAEIQALKDKFAEFKRIIEQENEKIAKTNAKYQGQKGYKQIPLLDVGQLAPIQQRAIEDVTYKQGTSKLEKDLEERKRIYTAYEEDRVKLGKEKADERYKNELSGFKSYKEYLDSIISQESTAFDAVNSKTADAGQQSRVKLIQKEYKDTVNAEQKKQSEVLALMISYDQKRKNMISEYQTERTKQLSTATSEEIAEYDRRFKEELYQFDDSNAQKIQSFKDLFNGIERLTDAQAKKLITEINSILESGINVSPEMRKRIKEALKDITQSLDARLTDRVSYLSSAFSQMGQEVSGVNESLGTMLTTLGGVLDFTVQIADNFKLLQKSIENYNSYKNGKSGENGGTGGAATGLLGGISAVAGLAGPIGGIVAGVAGVASGVIKFFGAAKESARQAEKQLKEYQNKIEAGELEYNRLIRDRERSQKSINDMTIKELNIQKQLLETQLQAKELRDIKVQKDTASFLDLLRGTQYENKQKNLSDYEYALQKILTEGVEVTGQKKEKYGGIFGIGKKTRLVDVTASLAGKTYEDLERLYTEGKMNESTRALFENLQKAKKEVDDISQLMKDIDEQIMDKMSGSLQASSISDNIIQGFKDGKRAVSDFADSAEEIIRNALLSAMSATVLEEPLMDLVKKFREDSKDGLSEDEINKFKTGYEAIVQSGLDSLKEIEKATGVKTSSKPSSNGSLQDDIQGITQQQAGRLEAEFGGFRIAQLQLVDITKANHVQYMIIAQDKLTQLIAIQQNTYRTANNTDQLSRLANIESAIVSLNNKVSSSDAARRGAGL